jgi:formate dehydrogenase major subunit
MNGPTDNPADPPFGTDWEHLDLDTATDMIAARLIAARWVGWQWKPEGGAGPPDARLRQPGAATLDNEENYLVKRLFTALGAFQW